MIRLELTEKEANALINVIKHNAKLTKGLKITKGTGKIGETINATIMQNITLDRIKSNINKKLLK